MRDLGCFASEVGLAQGSLSFEDGVWTWFLKEGTEVVTRDHQEWVWVPLEDLDSDLYADWASEIRAFFPASLLKKTGAKPSKR